jgi:hypothetical protein
MKKIKLRTIFITTSFIGYHSYKNAPNEVAFLKNEHRHKFNVKVTAKVLHNDRDIEYFCFKRRVDKIINTFFSNNQYNELEVQSCEDMAEKLIKYLEFEYKNQIISVEVNED